MILAQHELRKLARVYSKFLMLGFNHSPKVSRQSNQSPRCFWDDVTSNFVGVIIFFSVLADEPAHLALSLPKADVQDMLALQDYQFQKFRISWPSAAYPLGLP